MLLRKLPSGSALYLLGKWACNDNGSILYCYAPDTSVMSIIIRGNGDLPSSMIDGGRLYCYESNNSLSVNIESQNPDIQLLLGTIGNKISGDHLKIKSEEEFVRCFGRSWRGDIYYGFTDDMDSLFNQKLNGYDTVETIQDNNGDSWSISIDMLAFSSSLYSSDLKKPKRSKKAKKDKPKGQYTAGGIYDQITKPKRKIHEILRTSKPVIRSKKREVHTIRGRLSKATIAVGRITHRAISG